MKLHKKRQILYVTREQFRAIYSVNLELSSAEENKAMDYRFACCVNSIINGVTASGPMVGEYELVVNP